MSIKYENLHSFKEGMILLCQSILETRRISHLPGSAHFTIPLKSKVMQYEFMIFFVYLWYFCFAVPNGDQFAFAFAFTAVISLDGFLVFLLNFGTFLLKTYGMPTVHIMNDRHDMIHMTACFCAQKCFHIGKCFWYIYFSCGSFFKLHLIICLFLHFFCLYLH